MYVKSYAINLNISDLCMGHVHIINVRISTLHTSRHSNGIQINNPIVLVIWHNCYIHDVTVVL